MAATIEGAGGTAIHPVLSEWASAYHGRSGVSVGYRAIGSGGGIKAIEAGEVMFANSDMPLTPEQLRVHDLAQFPAVIIGITPVVNLPGVEPGQMVLDGKVLADIYLGKITRWNDPAIRALNPDLPLADMRIVTVHRSDASGTTFNFTNYLSKVMPEWKRRVGANTSVVWPIAGVGGKGNPGVAAHVQEIQGAIGYVEYAYTMQTHMTYARMINMAGRVVSPDVRSFQAAAANADFNKTRDFYLILTNQPGAQSWPITAATYILMRKDASREDNKRVVLFARWFLHHGQAFAQMLDYVPLPARTVDLIENYWRKQLAV